MEIEIQYELHDSGWEIVSQTLKEVGMAFYEPHVHKKAFENSHTSIFVFHSDRLIGFGRAISDNENRYGEFHEGRQHDIARLHRMKTLGPLVVREDDLVQDCFRQISQGIQRTQGSVTH